jgi:hypothetical protein
VAIYASKTSDRLPTLPQLDEGTFRSVGAKEKATVALQMLRKAAATNRSSKSRRFYSIRVVAKHFALPTTTVTRMYRQLREEGLLGAIWGSRTIIEPVNFDSDIRVKAVVGLPISLRWFSTTYGYRLLVSSLQEELWAHGFCPRTVFYKDDSAEMSLAVETLCSYHVNLVIWIAPSRQARLSAARFRDRAVPCINLHNEPPLNGDPGYFINNRTAMLQALRMWKSLGISEVILLGQDNRNERKVMMLRAALQQLEFRLSMRQECSNRNATGAIATSVEAWSDFEREPSMRRRNLSRLLHLQGAPDSERRPGMPFDSIEWDSKRIARRLAADIAERTAHQDSDQIIFESLWFSTPADSKGALAI